jgi:hypothetical protein
MAAALTISLIHCLRVDDFAWQVIVNLVDVVSNFLEPCTHKPASKGRISCHIQGLGKLEDVSELLRLLQGWQVWPAVTQSTQKAAHILQDWLGACSGCFSIQIAHPSVEVKVHKLDHYIREFATILNTCVQVCEWSVGKIKFRLQLKTSGGWWPAIICNIRQDGM